MARKKKHPHSKSQTVEAINSAPLRAATLLPPDLPSVLPEQSWVKGRGLSLYILWRRSSAITPVLPEHDAIWNHQTPVNLWMVTQCQWVPSAQTADTWLPLTSLLAGCDVLHSYLATVRQSLNDVAYVVLHLEETQVNVPIDVVRSMRKQKQHRKRALIESMDGALEEVLDLLQQRLRLNESALEQGWAPGRFIHFDRATGQRGWLIVSPREAIAVRLSVPQIYNFISLLQPQDIEWPDQQEARISAQRYGPFYERVMQWNATNDIFETVAQLEAIVEDSQKSTDGQLWLNFALAGIGILLSLFSFTQLNWFPIAAIVSLVGASICHAFYARSGKYPFQVAGGLFFAISIVLVVLLYILRQPILK